MECGLDPGSIVRLGVRFTGRALARHGNDCNVVSMMAG